MRKSLEEIRKQYSEKSSDSEREKGTRTSSGTASDEAPKKVEASTSNVASVVLKYPEFVSQPSVADFSKTDFCSSAIADDLGILYDNETVSDLFSKSTCSAASDRGAFTTAGHNWKEHSSLTSAAAPKSAELSSTNEFTQHTTTDFSDIGFPNSSAADNMASLYTCESASNLFPGSSFSASDQDASTSAYNIPADQISVTFSGASKPVVFGLPAEAIDPQPTSETNFSISPVANENPENNQVPNAPTKSQVEFNRSDVRSVNSHIDTSISQMSCESFQRMMFGQLEQFAAFDGIHGESNDETSHNILDYSGPRGSQLMVTNNLQDVQLASEVLHKSDETTRKLPKDSEPANNPNVSEYNNQHLIIHNGDNSGSVVDALIHLPETSSREKPLGTQPADTNLHPPSSSHCDGKSISHKDYSIPTFERPKVSPSFEIDQVLEQSDQLPNSCLVQETNEGKVEAKLMSRLIEKTPNTIQSQGMNNDPESVKIVSNAALPSVPLKVEGKPPGTNEGPEMNDTYNLGHISYCAFVPDSQSSFNSVKAPSKQLPKMSIILEERKESEISGDPAVSPSVLVSRVRSGLPPANDSNGIQPAKGSNDVIVRKGCGPTASKYFDRKEVECLDKLDIPCDFPIPKDYFEHKWILETAKRFVIGISGCCYEGDVCNKKMHGYGRFYLKDRQFIEGKWEMNTLFEPNFCLLNLESRNLTIFMVKQLNGYLVSTFEDNFVAMAIPTSFKELDFNASVDELKDSFLGTFKIVEIMKDELRSKRDRLVKEFKGALKAMPSEDADVVKHATINFLLGEFAKIPLAESVLRAIQENQVFPISLREAATNLLVIQSSLNLRNHGIYLFASIAELEPDLDLREIMFNVYSERVTEHRRSLVIKCPNAFPSLLTVLQSLPAEKILYITREDVGVIDHMLSLPSADQYKTFIGCFLEQFIENLISIGTGIEPRKVIPLISPVYGYLFKSFTEIVCEIVDTVDECHSQDVFSIGSDGKWQLKDNIKWPVGHKTSSNKPQALAFLNMSKHKSILHRKSLEAQYHTISQMMDYFSPSNYNKDRGVTFEFLVLKYDPTWWQQGAKSGDEEISFHRELQGLAGLSNERLAWLQILDKTVHQVFKDDLLTLYALKMYNPLLQGYISFLQKSADDAFESFRVLTHTIIQFLVSTAPYFRDCLGNPGPDFDVLIHQMWTMQIASRELKLGPAMFANFRDLIAEYNRYWSLRPFIDVKTTCLSAGYFKNQIYQLVMSFVKLVGDSLTKPVPIIYLVQYLRFLNDFMDDFKDMDFASCWFVKSDFYNDLVMEKVNNKLSATGQCSYRVTNVDGYIQLMKGNPIPNHYIIEVMTKLIECVNHCLRRHWSFDEENHNEPVAQLQSTGILLDAIRQSFLYLKEQPEYVDFETFTKESVDPFMRLVLESTCLSDFKHRTNVVKESFWYIRNMDELGIHQAISLFASVNEEPMSGKLMDCYNLYLKQYNSYIETYVSHLTGNSSHEESLEIVRRTMKNPEPVYFSNWTEDFKTKEIPSLLAGLSAVWSIMVSKDVSSSSKFLKPHCIQILCVMRLLSLDKPKGAENHLAQVLTGQGKSLILGLLSSVLALTGHKVRVVCYSKYLSTRDESNFKEFFEVFKIADKICYGTFRDMANGFLKPLCNGVRTNLRKMVCERVLYHTDWGSLGSVKTESSDTVLLIDEVDVFFNDQFYGNYYDSLTTVVIRGLSAIQEQMWGIAKDRTHDAAQVVRLTEMYISDQINSGNRLCMEWENFRQKPGTFLLLVDDANGKSRIKEYTNRSLTDEHLLTMAEEAVLMGNDEEMDRIFKLNEEGLVCMRNSAGQYFSSIIQSYKNTFAYFKLKGSNYDSMNSRNYGYLLLRTGKISYARLPSQFPLIMGVSGTLKDLNEYEKIGIKSYNIKTFSILPSFFGDSNLKFNTETDFKFVCELKDWLNTVYRKANEMVQSQRAVLIFFDSDVRLSLFAKEYKTKFDRVNEITLNTDSHLADLYINEAGITCTVTLATRVMGRGLDYKSSLAVEKNGGIHVIQTFFSVDVKEEIQIRGRTARKDNRGSYELIVCREHLIQKGIITNSETQYTYASLQPMRRAFMNNIGKGHSEMIMKSEHDHEITMTYYGLSQLCSTSFAE